MWVSAVLCLCVSGAFCQESLLVDTAQGPVKGYKDAQLDIFVFYNLKYATAPTGAQKFKAPLPPPNWTEPFEAVDQQVICPQYTTNLIPSGLNTQEDCLIANVYVPNTDEKNIPVIVYIHPGGFIIGYGGIIQPKNMVASKRIIAVTFNYRLAASGFLCMGTKDIPGNAGMKDQVALLRWVKQNIAYFGGNPDDVSIDGYSAGASSTGLLMLSKMARGLFNKVMEGSGDILSPYTVQTDPIKNSKEYAQMLNFENVDDLQALEEFYKNASIPLLLTGNIGNRSDFTFLFAPCVERDIGEERFLDDDPISIIKSGDFEILPMLSGFSNMEGLMRIDTFDQWKVEMNNNFSDFMPADLKFSCAEERERVAQNIKQFYFGDQPVDDNTILGYVDFLSDGYFLCPALRSAKLLVEAGHTSLYLYEYSYVDNNTDVVPHTNVRGAGHCAELFALNDEENGEDNLTDEYRNWKALMRDTWLEFIVNGKPESGGLPEWKPVSVGSMTHMRLRQHPVLKHSLLEKRCSFWEEIYNQYYQKPIPPSSSCP